MLAPSKRRHTILVRSVVEDERVKGEMHPEALTLLSTSAAEDPVARPPVRVRDQARAGGFTILGLPPSPELLAISMVYFVQGILGLSRLAMSFFFKDDLGLDPAQVALISSIAGIPWMVKPFYGFLSDTVPLWGYRRRSYLVACGLLGSASWVAMATLVRGPVGAAAMMVVGALSTACSDVVVDSLVVERARGEPQATAGSLQSLCWASAAAGGIISAYFSGSLVQTYGVHAVFGLTAVFPLVVCATALLIDERPVTARALPGGVRAQLGTQMRALWGAVSSRDILLPTVFVFLWQATPSCDQAMFYFHTNHLHFTPEFLGRVRLAGACASLAGVAIYNRYLKKVPLRKMLLWGMLLGTVLGSTQLLLVSGANRALGLSDQLFVLGDSVILTVLGQVSFMPILVLAAQLCPPGVEATVYATLMSCLNGGSFLGSALGGGLTAALGVSSDNFDHMVPLVAICTISTLAPWPFLGLVSNHQRGGSDGGGGSGNGGGVAQDPEKATLLGSGDDVSGKEG